jgi:adenosylcobinamide-GDP ribazoletransferase
MINDILLALQFLTIIPLKMTKADDKSLASSLIYYSLIGFLLGAILAAGLALLMVLNFQKIPASIILVVLLIIFTGGLHLDGLSDTFDAFLSRKPREEMLQIMRDSHAGVLGIVAVICVILLKIAILSSLSLTSMTAGLLLMCVSSRWSMVFSIFLFPYARKDGKAKVFIEGITPRIFIFATITGLACAGLIAKFGGIFVFGISALGAYVMGKFINLRLGGVTGDTLGATNEITEIVVLFSICILERTGLWMA